MSGKFMNIKKIIIPTITMVIIASQLMGCAAASQSELLQMINQGDAIEIEIATPINQEQGEQAESVPWEELAGISANPDLRKSWDDTLGIINTDTGKNGILYVNTEGANDNNNTLRVALHNREFIKYLENTDSINTLAEAVANNYADIELDLEDNTKAVYMGINGYFNLLPDSTPNYSNPDSTLTRAEFMTMVMRAVTPVTELETDETFATAVGSHDLNLYAQEVAENSYLDITSKSLNNLTYNGTITRAEALYMLVDMYYSGDEAGSITFTDAKDGGDIATKQKFIEDGVAKDYWKSYELTYAIQNPDEGLPTDLYKALVVAYENDIITTTETRWDEGLTKSEAIEFIVNALKNDTSLPTFTSTLGTITANNEISDIENDEITQAMQQADKEATDLDSTLNESDGVEIVEVLDTAMYVVKAGNLRTGDGTNFNLMDTLVVNAELHVTGKTANGWYEVTWGDGKGYAPAECLSTEKPAGLVIQEEVTDSPISDELQEEVNRLLEEMDSQYDETDNGSGGGLFFEDNPDWEGGGKAPDGTWVD